MSPRITPATTRGDEYEEEEEYEENEARFRRGGGRGYARGGRGRPLSRSSAARGRSSPQRRFPRGLLFRPPWPGYWARAAIAAPTTFEPPAPPEDAAPPSEPEPSAGAAAPADAAPEEPAAADAPPESTDAPQEEVAAAGAKAGAVTSWRRLGVGSYPAAVPAGGGIYIVERAGRPLYVGEAESFRARFAARLLGLYQLGLIDRGRLKPPFAIVVWFGAVNSASPAVRQGLRKAVIHALVTKGQGRSLRNNAATVAGARGGGGFSGARGLLPPIWASGPQR